MDLAYLADPEFLPVTPLLLRLLELVLAVDEACFLVGCPGCDCRCRSAGGCRRRRGGG